MGVFKIQALGLLLLIALGAATVFGLYNQLISWHKDEYTCYGNKHWINAGDRQRWMNIGKLNLFYQPVKWDCEKDHQYDGSKYQPLNGQLVPLVQGQ